MTRLSTPKIRALKGQRQMVTLSLGTASLARVADEFCDLILVGDSINMTIYGQPSTRGISLETMIAHGKSVVRSTKNAAVVVDMPFGTYEQNPSQAFANAERVLRETECDAVKLEGGLAMVPTIEFLIARGVPVMGHVGLYPQHSAVLGGFVKERDADKVIAEAKAQADAGVFCMVVEAVPADIAKAAAMAVDVPVIGIAAGDAVDGQILVVDDLIGVNPAGAPPFVRQKAQIHSIVRDAVKDYANEVRSL